MQEAFVFHGSDSISSPVRADADGEALSQQGWEGDGAGAAQGTTVTMTDGTSASQCCCSSSSMEELCVFPNEEKFTAVAVWQHSQKPSYWVPFWEGEQGECSPQGAAPADHRGQPNSVGQLGDCDKEQELFLLCDQIY